MIGDSDTEGDDQRLGDCGVLDLVRVCGGSQPDQVQIDELAVLRQLLLDSGKV
jgi:hypothetical protein